ANEQVPAEPARLHALHCSVQAALQHTPSTQNPDAHWLVPLQLWPPASLGTQAPPEQKSPAMQSASAAHVVLQAVGPHTKGVQLVVCGAGQLPAPLQLAAAVATPAVQLGLRHWTDELGKVQDAVLTPLQEPLQSEPSPLQAARGATG